MLHTAWIDLSACTVLLQPTETDLEDQFLGGRGVGAALLFRHLADASDPLSPDNPLIFTFGPLTGTPWPSGARYHVTFLSPLTGIYGYANAGGFFGAALRRAGYSALIITGRAKEPVYLEVTPTGVTIQPAVDLWGLGTEATHDTLATGGSRVACIGPAGENHVRFAAIISDRGRAAARCGGGAVMGSKNLKAIVARGQHSLDLPPAFRELARHASKQVRDHPGTAALREWGTVNLVAIKNRTGDLPAHNHQLGQVPGPDRIDARAVARYVTKRKGCFACPIRCGPVTHIEDGPYAGTLEGPEYESLDALGPMCGVDNLQAIMYANRRCNDLGLDTISTGVAIAFAMECHQEGILNDPDLSLAWGDEQTVLGLIEQIARQRGLGAMLAEGVRRAAKTIGGNAPRYAMHVKGMELPRQEPRIAKGFGLGHATSNRGADHLYALPTIDLAGAWDAAQRLFPPEIVTTLMDTDDETNKPDLVVFSEHYCALSDALGVCKFTTAETYALFPDDLAAGLSALWGREISAEQLLTAGERIVNLERLFNVRLGLTRADDRLPTRFTTESLDIYDFASNATTGQIARSEAPVHTGILRDFEAMLDRYYDLRGWDRNGIPTEKTLQRLNLDAWDQD